MAHPIYRNAKGERIPSVTTILANLGWNKDALMYWAWSQGTDGKDFRETSKDACDVGTIAHAYAEAQIKGEAFDVDAMPVDDEKKAKAKLCCDAWNQWRDQTKLQIIASEESLVSAKYDFGGTLDCCAVHTKRSILDIKTGGGVYPDYLLQIRAYGELWMENKHEDIEEYHLIRLGKEDGSFHHHYWPAESMHEAWNAFLSALALHRGKKILSKMAA